MRVLPFTGLLVIGLLASSGSVLAKPFEFAGLSRATTLQHVARQYPNSMVSGSYVHVSPKDSHDHIFGIELFGPNLSNRLRINFESPDREYPPCEFIERSIVSRHGPASQIREFREEAAHNRYLVWKLEVETIQLQCFRFDKNAKYFADAIIVHPSEPKPAPSNPGVQRTPANGHR
jgi:hypothetical protein